MATGERRNSGNWWRGAFILALVAFEFAREEAVVQANEPTTGNLFSLQSSGELVSAEGEWFRSDAGSPLVRNSTVIQCNRSTNTCTEGSAALSTSPTRSAFESVDEYTNVQFSADAVDYMDDSSVCMIHRVHIDIAQQRVTSTSTRKESTVPFCAKLEANVASELSDSIRHRENAGEWMSGHFLPLLRLIRHG